MYTRFVPFFIASSIILISTTFSFADDTRGRLPDGRAYRTDSEGNQLVDYIAELEMMNDALRRQVSGLEVEVEQKQALLDSGGAGAKGIVERDIKAGNASITSALQTQPVQRCDCAGEVQAKVREIETRTKQSEKEFLNRINALQAGKSEDLAFAQQKIERLMNESAQKDALIRSYEQSSQRVAQEKGQVQGSISIRKEEVGSLKKEAEQLETQIVELQGNIASLQSQVASLQNERETLSSQEAALVRVVDEKRKAIAEAEEARRAAEEKARIVEADLKNTLEAPKVLKAQPVYVEEQAPVVETQPKYEVPTNYNSTGMRASYSMARDSAFDALRGRLTTTLNQIQGLIATRDRMYKEYVQSERAVAFRPADARSIRGLSVPQIKRSIQEAQTARELSLLTREVNEIRSKIEFDIGMMERVKRLR